MLFYLDGNHHAEVNAALGELDWQPLRLTGTEINQAHPVYGRAASLEGWRGLCGVHPAGIHATTTVDYDFVVEGLIADDGTATLQRAKDLLCELVDSLRRAAHGAGVGLTLLDQLVDHGIAVERLTRDSEWPSMEGSSMQTAVKTARPSRLLARPARRSKTSPGR